ncbi:MAG: hypothetical protein ACFFER_19825, partial [Candidatus Thorarchaeota archaeon]
MEADDTWGSYQGFGHEEWNFQTKDAVDGYVYGYVFPRPARVADVKSKFRVVFYSIAPDGTWYVVGEYSEAEVSTTRDAAKLDLYFEENGIYEERTEQLIPLTSDRVDFLGNNFTKLSLPRRKNLIRKELKDSILKGEYKLKCPVESVVEYPGNILVDSALLKELQSRGTQYIYPFYPSPSVKRSLSTRRPTAKKKIHLDEGAYWRLSPQRKRRVWKRHNAMSNQFAGWLKQRGYKKVSQEANRVDVEFRSGTDLCRAEL